MIRVLYNILVRVYEYFIFQYYTIYIINIIVLKLVMYTTHYTNYTRVGGWSQCGGGGEWRPEQFTRTFFFSFFLLLPPLLSPPIILCIFMSPIISSMGI